MSTEISREELKQRLDHPRKLTLLDVLPPGSYRHSHLPGAINSPLEQIRIRALGLLPSKDQEIVVYCASAECHASDEAARQLVELGYSRVRHYVGGKADWKAAGLPLASDEDKRAV